METVLVTGFGPFLGHPINASWEAVKLLPFLKIENVNVVVKEIPVAYEKVDEIVPKLWKDLKPKLVIHVGVHSAANTIQIETKGHRTGYVKLDCMNKLHPTTNACCSMDGEDCIKTKLNLESICKNVNLKTNGGVELSLDAGRYLCEYIYYTSLRIDCTRTLFVHVPSLNNPHSAEKLANILRHIIIAALDCLDN